MEFTGPIFVLTPGRVGTRTISNSLNQAGHQTIHLHAVGPAVEAMMPMLEGRTPEDLRLIGGGGGG